MIEIKEGAVFVSDAHANTNRTQFYEFLKRVDKKEIDTPQLIFMGDMFDLLIGGASYLEKFYEKEIKLINKISKQKEIFYLEGNHDFNLQILFPNIKVYKLSKQPVLAVYHESKILISHGDCFEGFVYKFVHTLFRHSLTIKLLNIIDNAFENKLTKSYLKKVQDKQICKKIENFTQMIKQKILLYDIGVSGIGFVLEGHYHQGIRYEFEDSIYFNFPSYACGEKYYTVKGDKITFQ